MRRPKAPQSTIQIVLRRNGLVEAFDCDESGRSTSKRRHSVVVVAVLGGGLGLFLCLASTLNIDR